MQRQTGDVLGRAIDDSNTLKLRVRRLSPDAVVPTLGTAESAGFDLYATEGVEIENQRAVLIHTGIAVEIPKGYVGLLFARSGIATKKHLRPSNCVGVIDSDYRGEVMVSLYNDNYHSIHSTQTVSKGERVAQLVILPYISPELVLSEELSDTDRGEGGFGSTDKK